MRIAIVGAGALGSLFGGLLARSGHEVWLYNCSFIRHIEAIRASGLTLEMDEGEQKISLPAVRDVEEIPGSMELVGIFVKAYDTERALLDARPLMGEQSWVLSLQNGLGLEDIIRKHVPEEQILRGVTACGATLLEPGRVRWAGRGATYLGPLGEVAAADKQRIHKIIEAFNEAGIEAHYEANPVQRTWEKLLVNAAINPLTALFDVPNGALVEDPKLRAILHDVIHEALPLVAAQGIDLSLEEAIRRVEGVCRATAKNLSSMLQDVRRGKRTEIDFLNGALVREGKRLSIPTPLNRLLTELILRR